MASFMVGPPHPALANDFEAGEEKQGAGGNTLR
jgi:hypothetical protein